MDFLSFLRGGGGYGSYPTVPIMQPRITGAATPNLSSLAQFIAMIRPNRTDRPWWEGPQQPGSVTFSNPYTGQVTNTRSG